MQLSDDFPTDLYKASQVRELDRRTIEDEKVPGITLMRRAGQAAFNLLRERWPGVKELSIWCGAGNNGGDGYIVAGLAVSRGISVQLVQVGAEEKLRGDAKLACDWARELGVIFESYQETLLPRGQIIVDALLGTGLTGDVRGNFKAAIEKINNSRLPVLAIDICSGLCSDSGTKLGTVVHAEATVTFIGVKRGLLTAHGPACSGQLIFADLSVPPVVYQNLDAEVSRVDLAVTNKWLTPRSRTAHKGDFGHLLIVGGNLGMGGATLMASQAACRIGAGLVSLATRPEHLAAMLARCPEVMVHGINSGQDLDPLLERADVIVVGPGLGRTAWSEQLLRAVLATQKILIVDADALNLIASGVANHCRRDNWILTPHPGEAARLLNISSTAVQMDRFAAAKKLQMALGGVTILKGAGSLIADKDRLLLCSHGNPGMAAGGMGDVLSGVLGGLLAQNLTLEAAAPLGVCLHSAAADIAAESGGERGLMASDLFEHLRALVNPDHLLTTTE